MESQILTKFHYKEKIAKMSIIDSNSNILDEEIQIKPNNN